MTVGQTSSQVAGLTAASLVFAALALATWVFDLSAATAANSSSGAMEFISAITDDPVDTPAPGLLTDVGRSSAALVDTDADGVHDAVSVSVVNAYPGYSTTVDAVIRNRGITVQWIPSVKVTAPAGAVNVSVSDIGGTVLTPSETVTASTRVEVLRHALQAHRYAFRVQIGFARLLGGTIGFWRNWNNHFSRQQVEGWLRSVDDTSSWLGPRTVAGMRTTLDGARGGTPREKFLGHYLATRLNLAAGRLHLDARHNTTSVDPANTLGLANPSSATTREIVAAIEARFGTNPSPNAFRIMKDVCDALNNLEI